MGIGVATIFDLSWIIHFLKFDLNSWLPVFVLWTVLGICWIWVGVGILRNLAEFLLGLFFIILTFGINAASDSRITDYEGPFFVQDMNLAGDLAVVRKVENSHLNLTPVTAYVKNRGCSINQFVTVHKSTISCRKKVEETWLLRKIKPGQTSTGGWLYAVLSGDKTFLDYSMRSIMRDLGLSHMCAVSGFHLSIILFLADILRKILRSSSLFYKRIFLFKVTKITSTWDVYLPYLVTGTLIFYWLFFIGFKSSAIRAVVCFAVSVLAPKSANKLHVSLIVFCILSPFDVINFSSVLSWSSYLLIIFSHRKHWAGFWGWLLSVFKIQMLIGLMSMLIIGELSLLSLFGNIIVMPFLVWFIKIFVICIPIVSSAFFLALLNTCDQMLMKFQSVYDFFLLDTNIIVVKASIPQEIQVCFASIFFFFIIRNLNDYDEVELNNNKQIC